MAMPLSGFASGNPGIGFPSREIARIGMPVREPKALITGAWSWQKSQSERAKKTRACVSANALRFSFRYTSIRPFALSRAKLAVGDRAA